MTRLPAYPSYLEDDERWLDGTGGAGSVRAAALRSADAAGLARGSDWCPGSTASEREGRGGAVILPSPDAVPGVLRDSLHENAAAMPTMASDGVVDGHHHSVPRDGGAAPEQHLAQRQRVQARGSGRRGQSWRVDVTEEGLLRGCPQPSASARIADLLAAVLEGGHELSEADMMLLFAVRGVDFQVVLLCCMLLHCHITTIVPACNPAALCHCAPLQVSCGIKQPHAGRRP